MSVAQQCSDFAIHYSDTSLSTVVNLAQLNLLWSRTSEGKHRFRPPTLLDEPVEFSIFRFPAQPFGQPVAFPVLQQLPSIHILAPGSAGP